MRNLLIILSFLAVSLLQACIPLAAGGIVAGALVAEDRRTVGAQAEDQSIEIKALNRIGELFKDKHHVNVTSYNKQMLLTGEVPTEQMRTAIEAVLQGIEHVGKITNEIVVGPTTSFSSRSSDTLITSKIKTKFATSGRGAFYPNHVKVVTENNAVYLMGIVTKQEGDAAAAIAADTTNVTRVVKVFEYREALAPAGATRTEAGAVAPSRSTAPGAPATTVVAPAPTVGAPASTVVVPSPATPAGAPTYTPPSDAPLPPPAQAPMPVPLPK